MNSLLLLRIYIKIQNIVLCTVSSIQKNEYVCTVEQNLVMNATKSMFFNSQHSGVAHYDEVPFWLELLMIYRAACRLGVTRE